ncbi:MAG: class E sortase [Methanobacteriaceae archaeon]|jgi:LPXTG-site transpeptidase (sortase) family protein|nr:class E sortase [Methanobacteriaceae archaeon]
MNKPSLITIFLIILIIVVGFYTSGEVNYYSSKIAIEKDLNSPVILIPKLGIEEKINNVSVSQGVYHEELSKNPGEGEVILFGHRTLQGSPFLRLNELSQGDTIILEWPGIGEVNYTVDNSTIVPESYRMDVRNDTNNIYLITCDPIGSSENRLICQGEMSNIGNINEKIIKDNPQKHYALIIILAFITIGAILVYFYPKENRIYILITIIIISIILIYFYFFPIPSDIIYSKIGIMDISF